MSALSSSAHLWSMPILGFKDISGADIGLLIKEQDDASKSNDTRIPQWNVRVAALTSSEKNPAYSQ